MMIQSQVPVHSHAVSQTHKNNHDDDQTYRTKEIIGAEAS